MKIGDGSERKCYGIPLLFDPREGQTIIAPSGQGEGQWAGAPSVLYDRDAARFYLSYRVRKPRPVRGGEAYIAESQDGVHFHTIWSVAKEQFDSPSMERFSLNKALDGKWLLYPSYVDPADNRWRIDVIEADSPSGFDPSTRRPVFTGPQVGAEGVKDPWVMIVNGLYYMLISYAVMLGNLGPAERARMHASADIYNTGLTLSSSALAVSGDGRRYTWLGDVLSPAPQSWDAYAARLGCLVPTAQGWLGYYDGSAAVGENYEERTGLVQTFDLRTFYRLSTQEPCLTSPYGTGSLRYIDAVVFEDELWFYYEMARADGSHELRMNRVPRCAR